MGSTRDLVRRGLRLLHDKPFANLNLNLNLPDCQPQLKETRTPTSVPLFLIRPNWYLNSSRTKSAEKRALDHLPQPVLYPRLRFIHHHEQTTARSACQHLPTPPATRPQILPIATMKYENCCRTLPLPRPIRPIQLEKPRETRKHRPPRLFWEICQIY